MLSNEQVRCLSQSVANTAINEREPIKKPFCDSKSAKWFVRCDRNRNIVTWYETGENNAFVKYYDNI